MKATNNLYNGVHGMSTIDHRIRMKLGLSINEYVVLDFAVNLKMGLSHVEECWKRIGMTPEEYSYYEATLYLRHPNIVELWLNEFNLDPDFEVFWVNIFRKHGNKASAMKKYKECRSLIDKQTLHTRAAQYIMQCCPDFPNYTKAAEVWLNPKKRHWEDVLPGDRKPEKEASTPIFPKD